GDAEASELGAAILEQARGIRCDYSAFPRRVLHGDPKLSNLLFQPADPLRARCMIDLDTLGRGFLAYELGDALRSWANRAGEDQLDADLDVGALQAVLAGYARTCPADLPSVEIGSAIDGLGTGSLGPASPLPPGRDSGRCHRCPLRGRRCHRSADLRSIGCR
ncbi:hypothetical protein B4Q13_20930, partial [Lacticaseibacillus rhamnosus]